MERKHFNSIHIRNECENSMLDKVPIAIKIEYNFGQAMQCHYGNRLMPLNILVRVYWGKCDCTFRGDTTISLPASIVFITLFGVGKEAIGFGTMRWCFHRGGGGSSIIIFIVTSWCCSCGPQFRLRTVIIPICVAIQEVGIPFGWFVLLWCNQTYFLCEYKSTRKDV